MGPRDEDDGPPPGADAASPAALRLRLSAFGVLALALAAVGLYCLVSYSVARRTGEIGIRMALGADSSRVVRVLGAGGLQLVVIGGALGLTLAVVATRLLGGLLFEVDALDPLTFVGVPLVLGAAGTARGLPAGPPRQPSQSRRGAPDRLSAGGPRATAPRRRAAHEQ